MKRPVLILFVCSVLLLTPAVSSADDVTDQINEALKAYEKGDYSTAASALDTASTLVRQAKADQMAKLLPAPLKGWKLKDSKNTSAGAAMFGGGVNVKKIYVKDKQRVTVSLTTDSPMLQAVAMMYANPQIAGPNARLLVLNGQKFIHDTKKNSYTAMINNKALLAIEGKRKADPEAVKQYLDAIDIAKIAKFTN